MQLPKSYFAPQDYDFAFNKLDPHLQYCYNHLIKGELRKIENFSKFEYTPLENNVSKNVQSNDKPHSPAKFDFNEIVRNRIKNAAVNVASELKEFNSHTPSDGKAQSITPPDAPRDDEIEQIDENQPVIVSKRVMSIFQPQVQPLEISRKSLPVPLVPKQYVFSCDELTLFFFQNS